MRDGSTSAAWRAAASCGLGAVVGAAFGTVIVVEVASLGSVIVIVVPPGLDPAVTVDAAATPQAARTAAENAIVMLRRMAATLMRPSDGAWKAQVRHRRRTV